MRFIRNILMFYCLMNIMFIDVSAQQNEVYNKMTLEELLNIDVVVTASKRPEDLFEAPLSVSIIKKEEIENSGVTSIPEALRLGQGVIVREITPGNYDVHIRGLDDITKNAFISLPYNTTTLVMIDNRIVYSYFTGGTFWEAFPIDINDVERIEIVRGPASALYGPNAVTGVINIITSHALNKGLSIKANGLTGTNQAKNVNTNIGFNWDNKTRLSFSGNFTERRRNKVEYFDYLTQSYTSLDDQNLLLNIEKNVNTHELWTFKDYQEEIGASYDEEISLRKMGGNIFFSHMFSEKTNIDIHVGTQKSQSMRTGFINFVTPLSQNNSKSWYLNSRIKHNNFNGQLNVYSGEDLSNFKPNSYKFTNLDGILEYYKQFKNLSFRPGISYKQAKYNSPITYDEPYNLSTLNYQFKDEPRTLNSYAVSLLSEWKSTSKLRVIGAGRVDKFNINKNYSFNYEIASTYRINKNNLLRYVYSKADRSPFIFDTYLNSKVNINLEYVGEFNQDPINVPIDLNIMASKDLKFPMIKSQEIGWRAKLKSNVSLDLEVFHSNTKNFVVSNVYRYVHSIHQLSESLEDESILSGYATSNFIFENFDLKAQQYGASFMLVYNPSDKINAKLFGTYQKTKISGKTNPEFKINNIIFGEISEDFTTTVDISTFVNPTQWSEKLTPSFYGGFYLNYKLDKKWSINSDGYFYTSQRFIDFDYKNTMADYSGNYTNYYMDIKPNLVLNGKASYKINKNITTNLTFKNILGKHREFGYADQIGSQVLIGLKWEL